MQRTQIKGSEATFFLNGPKFVDQLTHFLTWLFHDFIWGFLYCVFIGVISAEEQYADIQGPMDGFY